MKRCKVCGEWKSLDDYCRAAGARDGHRGDCKACNLARKRRWYETNRERAIGYVKAWQQENRERHNEYQRSYRQRPERKRAERAGHLRRKFGITLADYERMLAEQGGGCAVCGEPEPEGRSLHVDHDHETGRVRGLLCVRCNNALGAFKESHDLFAAAAEYLDTHEPDAARLAGLARERAFALAGGD